MQTQIDAAFNHLVESLNNPASSQSNQQTFNDIRFNNVMEAMRVRPTFLPVQIEMPADIQTLPISNSTNTLDYDAVITGAISDGEDKKINLRRETEDGIPFVDVGKEIDTQISLDAIAGKSIEAGGTNIIQSFLPFLLRAGEALSVDVYKPVATNGIEVVSICFCGYRVYTEAVAMANFTDAIKNKVLDQIALRVTPEPRFPVCPVTFDADTGTATAETPKSSEPRIILGFRSTVKNALVNLGFDRESNFARNYFPIWALAAEAGSTRENYRLLKKPIFLEPNQQLFLGFKNTINGSNFANDGQIEILAQTV